jgi:hypothetical protein
VSGLRTLKDRASDVVRIGGGSIAAAIYGNSSLISALATAVFSLLSSSRSSICSSYATNLLTIYKESSPSRTSSCSCTRSRARRVLDTRSVVLTSSSSLSKSYSVYSVCSVCLGVSSSAEVSYYSVVGTGSSVSRLA